MYDSTLGRSSYKCRVRTNRVRKNSSSTSEFGGQTKSSDLRFRVQNLGDGHRTSEPVPRVERYVVYFAKRAWRATAYWPPVPRVYIVLSFF